MNDMVRWSPPSLLDRSPLRLFDELFEQVTPLFPFGLNDRQTLEMTNWPQVDISDEGEHLVVRADVPGLSPEELNVQVQNNMLVISGERTSTSKTEQGGYLRSERKSGRFTRQISLPEGIDAEKVEARYTHGVLELRMPKPSASAGVRRIPISLGDPGHELGSGDGEDSPAQS
jgi:HSP20 family protein